MLKLVALVWGVGLGLLCFDLVRRAWHAYPTLRDAVAVVEREVQP